MGGPGGAGPLPCRRRIWREINEVNLRSHILPTRERGDLILHKGPDHGVEWVKLRKI